MKEEMFPVLVVLLLTNGGDAVDESTAQVSVISSRSANGLLASRFSGSQRLTDLKKGYEISVTHDTKPCNNSQDTFFSVELKAPRSLVGLYSLVNKERSWTEASESCHDYGRRLADPPQTAEELRAILCVMNRGIVGAQADKKYVTLGFRYDRDKKDFVTVTGKALNTAVSPWAPHNPQAHHKDGAENCGAMDAQGRLHDVHCDYELFYVCQVP